MKVPGNLLAVEGGLPYMPNTEQVVAQTTPELMSPKDFHMRLDTWPSRLLTYHKWQRA